MPIRKLAKTDSITFADGITARQGVASDRNISIGDNSSNDLLLLENGDFLLQEDNMSKFLRTIPEYDD